MSYVQGINAQQIPYIVQEKEGKNLIEGVMWGVNGVASAMTGMSAAAGLIALDSMALATIAISPTAFALPSTVGLVAFNALSYYIIKAQFSIAAKSFTHMNNTI